MNRREDTTESLLREALAAEARAAGSVGPAPGPVLLIGVQAVATVELANRLFGAERVELLHLDRGSGSAARGLGNVERYVGGGDENVGGDGRFGVVCLNVEAVRNYRLLRDLVALLPAWLDPGGTVLLAGPRKGGAETAATALRERFGTVSLETYRKGHRLFRAGDPSGQGSITAAAGDAAPVDRPGDPDLLRLPIRGRTVLLERDERLFARGGLDPATALLAELFEIPAGAAVLDLGCGSGVLGIVAALIEPSCRVTMVDADPLAVAAARRNAALNGVGGSVAVHLSDVLGDLPGATFDVIVMNPPFHRGRTQRLDLAHRFIAEAGAALRPDGTLWLVCNRFLRYEPVVAAQIAQPREVGGDRRYKVLAARRTR